MRKIILLLGTLLFATSFFAQDTTFLKGDFNSWDSSMPMTLDGAYFSHTFQYTGITGENNFKIHEKIGDYWYGLSTVPDFINSSFITIYSGDGTDIKQVLTNNQFYTFKTSNSTDVPSNPNCNLVIFETDASPVTILTISDNSFTSVKEIDVTITLSATPSSQEVVYVCYTTDDWISSSVVLAVGTGVNYLATIPLWGGTVKYKVLTSTIPKTTLENNVDLYALRVDDNNGSDYSYTNNEALYEGKVVLRTDTGLAYISNSDFETMDLGSFDATGKLILNSFQNFDYIWSDDVFASTTANYRVYKQGTKAPDFNVVNVPYNTEWENSPKKQLWWNAGNDTTNIDVLSGLDNGTYNFEVYFTATKNDDFDVLLLDNDGNYYTATFVVLKTSTQLQNIENASYEVMVNNRMVQMTVNSELNQQATVTLISLAGMVQSLNSYSLMAGDNTIDLPQVLNQGIYILQVQIGKTRLVKKIVIQ